MQLRVGLVEYVNTIPLVQGILSKAVPCEARIQTRHPAKLNRLIHGAELDIALCSASAFGDFRDELDLLGPLGIAADGRVGSVFLYHKGPICDLQGKKVAVTTQSHASVRLLRLLAAELWKVEFELVPSDAPGSAGCEAFLLIGNEALRRQRLSGHQVTDLCEEWKKLTGLPFVFAVLAVRRPIAKCAPAEVAAFRSAVEASLAWGKVNQGEVLAAACLRMPDVPPLVMANYLSHIQYELTEAHLRSLELFTQSKEMVAL